MPSPSLTLPLPSPPFKGEIKRGFGEGEEGGGGND